MSARSYKLLVAIICLVAAWGILFTAHILEVGSVQAVPFWIALVLGLATGGLTAVSGASARTRLGIGLALVLTMAALASVRLADAEGDDLRSNWRRNESLRLAQTLSAVGEAVARLEDISASIGDNVGTYVLGGGYDRSRLTLNNRLEAFEVLDSLTAGISKSGALPHGTEIGIQLFELEGNRIAWAGWPQAITQQDRRFIASGKELIYSREVSLYRILTHLIPIVDNRNNPVVTALVDLPLEVNFRVNNRFLKSTSIAENIAAGQVANVNFEYYPARAGLPLQLEMFKSVQEKNRKKRARMMKRRQELEARELADQEIGEEDKKHGDEAERSKSPRRLTVVDSVLSYYPFPWYIEPIAEITGDGTTGLRGQVLLRSHQGNPIVTVTANSHPLPHFVDRRQTRLLMWGKAFVILALLVLFVHAMLAIGRGGRLVWLRAVLFVAFMVVLRYSLLSFQAFSPAGGTKIFDPTVFATPMLGGVMRSAGDLLITSIFVAVALYGLLKMIRSKSRGDISTGDHFGRDAVTNAALDASAAAPGAPTAKAAPPKPPSWHFVAKGIITAGALFGVFELARRFSEVVVANANPRLIGETMRLTDPSVIILHLGTFMMLTGILLVGVLAVWVMYRVTSWGDVNKSAWVAFALLVLLGATGRWEPALVSGLLLVFSVFAPRFVQREDLVSIVIVSFYLVIISSGSAYLFLNRNYDELRKNFIQEKAAELVNPSDNWKIVILEDVLEEYSKRAEIRRALRRPEGKDVQRLAFDLWASGPLSLLGYSSSIHVLTSRDSVISDFSVDMPYRARIPGGNERIDTPVENDWVILDLTRNTPQGIVRYYRGILNVEEVHTDYGVYDRVFTTVIGKVVVDLPFFFESLEWAARTGPRTPEVLRNVQEGGVAPRVEEPEALMLGRVDGRRINETSSENLPVGFTIPEIQFQRGLERDWPLLYTDRGNYRFFIQETDEPDRYLLAGFVVPSLVRHMLRWSTLLSLYLFFTVVSIAAIILLSGIPMLKELLPTLTPGRKLGFQQKLLASFLVVALVPAVILGVFSVNFIKARFIEENRQEALDKAFSARKAFVNLLWGEMQFFLKQADINRLFTEEGYGENAVTGTRLVKVYNEAGKAGVAGAATMESGDSAAPGEAERDKAQAPPFVGSLANASTEDLFLFWEEGVPFIGILSDPMLVTGEDWSGYYYVYFARRVGPELLGEIAEQVGADVNVYDGGMLVASSHEGLLAGGFISAIMNSDAFVKVSLIGSDHSLATERAGRYSYQVAYLPLISWGSGGVDDDKGESSQSGDRFTSSQLVNAAMSVPLVFRPESYYLEVQKASSIILGIFALLFAATIALGLFLARGIFEPLRGLLAGTRRISSGDLNVRLPMRRSDEIGIVVSAFNEMTEQLSQSQRTLEERRRYLETILANIGTGVISTDSEDRIHTINSAAERILGIKANTAFGRTASDIAGEGQAPEIFALLRDGKDLADPFVASEIEVLREGRKATIKYMMTKLQSEDRYLGTVFVFEDLTELIQTKKLSAWVEMARQIAHEIKNPLTPIRISTQFMQRAYEQKSDQFDKIFKESSQTIIHQVDVLKRIAGEFSSFGRMQQLDVGPHRLDPLVNDIITPYRNNPAGVEVNYDNGKPDAVVLVDPEAVRKICSNLLENAMEAMPSGGVLKVSCREESRGGESFIRVSFCDSGPGLSAAVEEKLFEPYFSTKTTGTGLGLAICRSLSQEMGGDVEVGNVPSGGVEASVLLRTE